MPRVPTYRSQTEPIGANQLPSVRMTAAPSAADLGGNARAPDSGIGEGLLAVGDAASAIYRHMRDQQDAQQVLNADTVASTGMNQYVAEARAKTGANAWNLTAESAEAFDSIIAKARNSLTSENAQRVFDARIAQRRQAAASAVFSHELQETKKTTVAAMQGTGVAAIQDAATSYADPDALADARKRLIQSVNGEAQQSGWPAEVREANRLEKLSIMHTMILQSMVANRNTQAAADYLQANGAEMLAEHRNRATSSLRTSNDIAAAQAFADAVEFEGMTETAAVAKARRELSGEAEERTVREIKQRFADRSAATERQQRDAADVAAQHYARGGLNAIPTSVWELLDGSRQMYFKDKADSDAYRIETRAAARASRAAAEESRAYTRSQRERAEAADRTYDDLLTMRATDPDAFASMDLRTVEGFGKLSDGQRKDMAESQAKLRDPSAANNIKAIDAAIEHGAKAIGASGKKQSAIDLRQQLETYVKQRVTDFAAEKNRAPTAAELRAIVDNGLVKGDIVKDWWPDASGYRFQAGERAFEPKLPRVTNEADYGRLPRGARYLDPQGVERIKR